MMLEPVLDAEARADLAAIAERDARQDAHWQLVLTAISNGGQSLTDAEKRALLNFTSILSHGINGPWRADIAEFERRGRLGGWVR